MAIPAPTPEFALTSQAPSLPAISAVPLTEAQLPEFVEDFFHWLENEWQLPVLSQYPTPPPLLLPTRLLDEERFSLKDLCQLWGWSLSKVRNDIKRFSPPSAGSLPSPFGGRLNLYRGRDLLPMVQHWEWQRLSDQANAHWRRFFQEPCGACATCKSASPALIMVWGFCARNQVQKTYRSNFFSVIKGIQTHGSIVAWWKHEFHHMLSNPSISLPKNSGLILLYLLDRHYLALSWEEIAIIFPLSGIEREEFGRPWRLKRSGEYKTFLRALADLGISVYSDVKVFSCLALLLLQHGLQGLAELSRPLTTEEIEVAVSQRYLLTSRVYSDVYLPSPQSPDIRLGHLLLDTLRNFLWKQGTLSSGGKKRRNREAWPSPLDFDSINAVEQILCSHIWYGNQGILVPRPETTKGRYGNPYRHRQGAEREEYAVSRLPAFIKEQVDAFLRKRYLEDHLGRSTLKDNISAVLRFLYFVQQQSRLKDIDTWDRNTCKQLFQSFDAQECQDLSDKRRYTLFSSLLIWFETLAELDITVPPGYTVLKAFIDSPDEQERDVPSEALLDRVFRDGVCQHPDPYIRLALTIQYFCGTRIQETVDMHFFCMWEDEDGRGYLTIPIGKGREERLFPVVALGMEPLVGLMEEIVQLHPRSEDHIVQGRVRANHYYLATDSAKATSWYYLFDRFTKSHGPGRRKAVLSVSTACLGLHQAVLLAAQTNPRDLFVEDTYNPRCQKRIKAGEHCQYLALRAEVTTCPICGGKLEGKRGERCYRLLKTDYACTGVATEGAWFCSVCDNPLAKPVRLTSHLFRHNSVTRSSRQGIPLIHNMQLHGHKTLRMHKHYNHPELKELYEKVQDVMEAMYLRNAQMQAFFTPGQVVVDGVAQSPSLEQYFGLTLRRSWRRETSGIWGGFVANMLSDEGVQSPVKGREEIYITEETYAHTVAQYRYDALGLAISEVSLEHRTRGKHHAQVPLYLNRQVIEQLVTQHPALNQQLSGNLAIRLIQGEIKRQRARLEELAAILQPWWQHYGSIDQLVIALTPTDIDPFYQEVSESA